MNNADRYHILCKLESACYRGLFRAVKANDSLLCEKWRKKIGYYIKQRAEIFYPGIELEHSFPIHISRSYVF